MELLLLYYQLSPGQTDAIFLANKSKHCWMLCVASVCMLLDVNCVLLHKVQNRSNFSANNSQHFFCSVIAIEAWRNNVGFVCTALPTLLGSRMLITHGLQRLMGCILPMMHCRSQHYWELLHPFTHYCQHGATTPNVVGATMLGVVASVCPQPQ